jgi:hypothetical protein
MYSEQQNISITKQQTQNHSLSKNPQKVLTLTGSFPLNNNTFTIHSKVYRLQTNFKTASKEIHCISTNSHCSRLFDDFHNGTDYNADYMGVKYQVTVTPDFITFLPNRRRKKIGSSSASKSRYFKKH